MNPDTSYHHGDLRRALLDAAHEMIRTQGAPSVTLRAVARTADVSHAAPYHHFTDKDALVAAVAEEGFDALRELVAERAAGADNPARGLQEAAVAYVVFAVQRPELFRVMFGPQLADKAAHPSLQASARAAYGVIEEGLRGSGSDAAESRGLDGMAVTSWAATHGLAMLLIDRQLGVEGTAAAEKLARQVTAVLWVGLAGYGTGQDSGPSR